MTKKCLRKSITATEIIHLIHIFIVHYCFTYFTKLLISTRFSPDILAIKRKHYNYPLNSSCKIRYDYWLPPPVRPSVRSHALSSFLRIEICVCIIVLAHDMMSKSSSLSGKSHTVQFKAYILILDYNVTKINMQVKRFIMSS